MLALLIFLKINELRNRRQLKSAVPTLLLTYKKSQVNFHKDAFFTVCFEHVQCVSVTIFTVHLRAMIQCCVFLQNGCKGTFLRVYLEMQIL